MHAQAECCTFRSPLVILLATKIFFWSQVKHKNPSPKIRSATQQLVNTSYNTPWWCCLLSPPITLLLTPAITPTPHTIDTAKPYSPFMPRSVRLVLSFSIVSLTNHLSNHGWWAEVSPSSPPPLPAAAAPAPAAESDGTAVPPLLTTSRGHKRPGVPSSLSTDEYALQHRRICVATWDRRHTSPIN